MAKETWDNHGSGQSTGPDYPGHNPSVGSGKMGGNASMTNMDAPSGYKRGGYTRSGTHVKPEK